MDRNIETPPSDEERQKQTLQYYFQLKNHTQNINQSLDKVKDNQLASLRQRYLYQIKKLQKYKQQYGRLKQIYQNLPRIIDQSQSVVEETKRTLFILMDTGFVKNKLLQVENVVAGQKQKHNAYLQQINKLKSQLKKEKQFYFNLKREDERSIMVADQVNNNRISQQISRKMKEVRLIKKHHKPIIPPIKIIPVQEITGEINRSFNLINNFKESLINTKNNFHKTILKQASQTLSNVLSDIILRNTKKIEIVKKDLVQIPKKKRDQQKQCEQQQIYGSSVQQKFKQRQQKKQAFRQQNPLEVLKAIIKLRKIDDLIKIIDSQKRPFVEAVQKLKKQNY